MKQKLIDAQNEIRDADGKAQTAINGLSGVIQPSSAYQPFENVLALLQGKDTDFVLPDGVGLLRYAQQQLQVLIDAAPDDSSN